MSYNHCVPGRPKYMGPNNSYISRFCSRRHLLHHARGVLIDCRGFPSSPRWEMGMHPLLYLHRLSYHRKYCCLVNNTPNTTTYHVYHYTYKWHSTVLSLLYAGMNSGGKHVLFSGVRCRVRSFLGSVQCIAHHAWL